MLTLRYQKMFNYYFRLLLLIITKVTLEDRKHFKRLLSQWLR